MKVIDLLNKIANGEAPKKIKINENILNLKIGRGTSYEFETSGGMLSFDYYIENNKLDTIVEIIEEDKKIEKLDLDWVEVFNFKEQAQQDCVKMVFNKINKIIDKINKEK